jgi:hypothetical protein
MAEADQSQWVEVWTDDAREAARWESAYINAIPISISNGQKTVYGTVRIFRAEEAPKRWQAYVLPKPTTDDAP